MEPTEEDANKFLKAWDEIKETIRLLGPIPPREYEKLYDKYNLKELTSKVIGWIGICGVCGRILQAKYIEDVAEIFDLKRCDEVIKKNGNCYILKKKCQSVSMDNNKCRDLSGGERFIFLEHYIGVMPIDKRKKYCSETCRQAAKSRRWRKENPQKKLRSNLDYLKFLEEEGDI